MFALMSMGALSSRRVDYGMVFRMNTMLQCPLAAVSENREAYGMALSSVDNDEASHFLENLSIFPCVTLRNFGTSTSFGFTPEHLEKSSKAEIFRPVDFKAYTSY
jgi:hypothetical protein